VRGQGIEDRAKRYDRKGAYPHIAGVRYPSFVVSCSSAVFGFATRRRRPRRPSNHGEDMVRLQFKRRGRLSCESEPHR